MIKIKRKVTIKDVARHAGVGIGTVSRAINNSPGINYETRRKILSSMKELEYFPHAIAQSMRSKKYKDIAFFADISNPVFAEIAKGSQLELEKQGYTLSLCSIGEHNVEDKISTFLYGRNFDGIILSIPSEVDEHLNKALSKIDIPILPINREIPTLPQGLVTDYYTSVKEAIKYLINLGHENITLITGSRNIAPTRDSIKAYKEVFNEKNISIKGDLIVSGELNLKSGEKLMNGLVPKIKNGEITALLSLNNQMFYGILKVMREKNIKYPDDISIITVEDNELTKLLDPPVTVIHRNVEMMGKVIAKKLLNQIKTPKDIRSSSIIIPTDFIIRDSCKRFENFLIQSGNDSKGEDLL